MNIKENRKYLAISDMLLSITMLSNKFNDRLDEDAFKVVKFIGGAFKFDDSEINEYYKLIKDDLTILSTTNDVLAYETNRGEKEYPEIADLLYLKSEVILKILKIYDHLIDSNFNQSYFDYRSTLRTYFPTIRFEELKEASLKGDVDVNRTVAIMLALGIGHEKDIDKAIWHFKLCAYWGDITSLYYLAYLYSMKNDEENSKLFSDLSKLSSYMLEGRTIIPKEVADKFDDKTLDEYKIISSIFLDIVQFFDGLDINHSFLEVILDNKLSYYEKMKYINGYRLEEWKKYTNSSETSDMGAFFSRKERLKNE